MDQSHAACDPEHAGKLLEQELGGLIGARRNNIGRGGAGKGNRHPVIYAGEKSDIPIVPTKSPNNGCCCPAEAMEGRGIATGKVNKNPACRTQSRVSASMRLEGLRDRAKQQRRENMN